MPFMGLFCCGTCVNKLEYYVKYLFTCEKFQDINSDINITEPRNFESFHEDDGTQCVAAAVTTEHVVASNLRQIADDLDRDFQRTRGLVNSVASLEIAQVHNSLNISATNPILQSTELLVLCISLHVFSSKGKCR